MFTSKGTYAPVGLFSIAHIIAVVVCVVLIALVAVLTRKMNSKTYFKLLKIFAIMLTIMELFKIVWNLAQGYTHVNRWVPLYFCSLFIYSLWFATAKNNFVKNLGLAYIACASIVAGAIFIVFPTTSFSDYPLFHFQCIYSMLFHSIMVYSGVMLFVTRAFKVDLRSVGRYCIYCIIFMSAAIALNVFSKGNLMFLADPGNIPLPFLWNIYNFSKVVYTLTIAIAHMLLGFVVFGVYKGAELIAQSSEEESEFKDV